MTIFSTLRSTLTVAGLALLLVTAAASLACADSAAEGPDSVLITGANRGLGLEFARQYAAAGWTVYATARTPTEATELEALDVEVLQLDVTDPDSVAGLAVRLRDKPLDLLINNAGIFPRMSAIEEVDFAEVHRTLDVNTVGPMRVTAALLPNLRRSDGRTIVHITSGLGSIANNSRGGFYGYRESKAALNMFNRTLAAQLADDGFTCIVMSPGWVQTDMGGPDANLTPEESVSGMREVISRLEPADTGRYYNHDGTELPW